jgi:hypothetical protein
MTNLLRLFSLSAAIVAGGLFATAPAAHAACEAGKAGEELSGSEAQAVYDCLKDQMYKGYNRGNKRWIDKSVVKDYRGWTAASTFPAAPGFHGERFLLTYVNAAGAEQYLKYEDEGVTMPAGTIIAKESFSVNAKGKAKAGPLFFMEKAAAGASPQTADWYYYMVAPSGAPMAVNVVKACHECHAGFAESDGMAYPVEEARVK